MNIIILDIDNLLVFYFISCVWAELVFILVFLIVVSIVTKYVETGTIFINVLVRKKVRISALKVIIQLNEPCNSFFPHLCHTNDLFSLSGG